MSERDRLIEILNSFYDEIGVNLVCYFTDEECERLADYLLGSGVTVQPVNVGDTVYVITTCRDFPQELDGSWETATGYYCPCDLRDNCPHNSDDCKSVIDAEAIFTDQITVISTFEERIELDTSYTGAYNVSDIGKTLFLTREAAEKALAERGGNNDPT